MKLVWHRFCSLVLAGCLAACASVHAAKETLSPQTIFIAGDSTAAGYNKPDQQGWGGEFQQYFDSNKVKIDNRARGGRSTRTFIAEGLWQALLDDVKAGDLVLIQFGHNDASPVNDDRRARGTLKGIGDEFVDIDNMLTNKQERVYTFGHYIRQMVADVRAKKATPILMSLTVRNKWRNERIERGSGQYGYWMYQLAWQLNTSFIDVTNTVADKLEALGATEVQKIYEKDHTHYNPQGAHIHAQAIVAGLKGVRPGLANNLYSELGQNVAADDWTWLRLPFPADQKQTSIFMVGDSTVRNGGGDGPNGEWGWGDFIHENVDTSRVNLVNRAVGGLSSRTFITGGFWQRALNMMKPGDYLLLQFGHNDAAALNDDSRARGTIRGVSEAYQDINNMLTGKDERVHSYGWYLRKMIGEARARGITPIICSPVPRKKWQEDGLKIARAENSYPTWAQQVARQSRSHFIDLHSLVSTEYEALGQKAVDEMFADKHTHTSKKGAQLTAKIVAEHLKSIVGI